MLGLTSSANSYVHVGSPDVPGSDHLPEIDSCTECHSLYWWMIYCSLAATELRFYALQST